MESPTLEAFLNRALVWPDPHSDTGWINLHWRLHNHKGITGAEDGKEGWYDAEEHPSFDVGGIVHTTYTHITRP